MFQAGSHNIHSNCPLLRFQERKQFLQKEGIEIKGSRKTLEDQKQMLREMCCNGRVASVEEGILNKLSPSPKGKIKLNGKVYHGSFDTGEEIIEKSFNTLGMCTGWIARMEHSRKSGKLRSVALADRDKPNRSEVVT